MEGRTEGLDPREENEILGSEHFRKMGEAIRRTKSLIEEARAELTNFHEEFEATKDQLDDEERQKLEMEINALGPSITNLENLVVSNEEDRKAQATRFLNTFEVEGKRPN